MMFINPGHVRRATLAICGGVTLGLELVASRILTPYFGTSLFVWTAILVVTLMALAIGYHRGGLQTRRSPDLARYFASLLIAGSISLLVGRFIATFALPQLAGISVVGGAFMGALILLALPLTYLSALNPALVAMERVSGEIGDAGSGSVFALSTLGSVAGAAVAAFLIIPFVDAPDILNLFAGLVAGLALLNIRYAGGQRREMYLAASVVLAAALIMALVMQPPRKVHYSKADLTLIERYFSSTGQVSVVQVNIPDTAPKLVYFQSGGFQGITSLTGEPLAPYMFIIDKVRAVRVPQGRHALVLGLAAGSIPMMFSTEGVASDIVDINPDATRIASDHFHFDAARFHIHDVDARVFLHGCAGAHAYDIIVFDVFSGMDPVEHMLTREAFADAAGCLAPNGVLAANVIAVSPDASLVRMVASAMSLATGAPSWGYSMHPDRRPLGNMIITSGGDRASEGLPLGSDNIPADGFIGEKVSEMQAIRLNIDPQNAVSDLRNRSSLALAAEETAIRRAFHVIPPLGW